MIAVIGGLFIAAAVAVFAHGFATSNPRARLLIAFLACWSAGVSLVAYAVVAAKHRRDGVAADHALQAITSDEVMLASQSDHYTTDPFVTNSTLANSIASGQTRITVSINAVTRAATVTATVGAVTRSTRLPPPRAG